MKDGQMAPGLYISMNIYFAMTHLLEELDYFSYTYTPNARGIDGKH